MKFLDIQAKGKSEVDLMMYGTISEWSDLSANRFVRQLSMLEKSYSTINLRIHSPGGSVFEGVAIYNAIKNSKAVINVYIDGIAASMASIIAIAADKTYMGKTSKMMIHQSEGGLIGNANQMKNYAMLLESINSTFAELYAEKTGKTKEWVTDHWLKDGIDTWFTAKQAKASGLVDEIVESKVPEPTKAEKLTEIAAHFEETLLHEDTETEILNNPDMKIIAKALGLSENATEQEIVAAIDKIKADSATASANLVIAMGEKVGCITADNKARFEKLAKLDADLAIEMMPDAKAEVKPEGEESGKEKKEVKPAEAHVSLVAALKEAMQGNKQTDISAERKDWDFTKWSKEDPEGLRAMAKSDPEKATKLLNATYGVNISQSELSKYIY